ncbi:MAG: hypothetical protein CMC55_00425 [Flavobacteriaceae bacterium]|nr:hypothetical protein [Flavobacteriaceae bacterium]
MRQIKTMTEEELLTSSVDLVSKTYIGLGQNNVEEDTISYMSQELAKDLKRIYKNFYFEDAQNAFYEGIRMDIKTDFIHFNIPVYIRWLNSYKDIIWEARAKFDSGENPKKIPHYRPEPKLLK